MQTTTSAPMAAAWALKPLFRVTWYSCSNVIWMTPILTFFAPAAGAAGAEVGASLATGVNGFSTIFS